MNEIYLDNSATTQVLPEVLDAMDAYSRQGAGNPASQHQAGRRARRALEDAREGIGALLGAQVVGERADRLIFTSGGTEANNLAVRGMGSGQPGPIIVSPIEHPSVTGPVDQMTHFGHLKRCLAVDASGRVLADQLPALLSPDVRLVSVMLGNHETGVLQPIEQLAAICNDQGVLLLTDAVQAAGKVAIDFRALGAAALTVSAHKFHGPCGIGALLVRHDVTLTPLLAGGFQQQGLRPGTEPVALAVGMFKALEIWSHEADERFRRMAGLRDRLEQLVRQEYADVVVHGRDADRLPHLSNLAFPGLDRQALAITLDLAGVACSTGSACASGSSEPSHVLRAMGLPDELVHGSLRFSLSALTTAQEVASAAGHIVNAVKHLRGLSAARKAAATSRQNTPETV